MKTLTSDTRNTNNADNIQEVTLIGPLLQEKIRFDLGHLHIFVDGGNNFRPLKMKNYLSIGDGDSFQGNLDILLDKNKDQSDLKLALELLPASTGQVNLKGFSGGRADHQLANFGEIHHFLKVRKRKTVVFSDSSWSAYSKGRYQLEINGTFSLFVLEKAKIVVSGQCHYPLEKEKWFHPLSSFGLSNVGNGAITVKSSGPFFVFVE